MKTFASLLVLAAMASAPALAADPSSSPSGSSSLGTSGSASSDAARSTSPSAPSSAMGSGSSSSMDQTAAMESNTDTVRQVEMKLKSEGYDVGEVDGVMDDKARQALMKYQEKKGLQQSGKIDSSTMASLDIKDSQQAATPGSGAGSSPAGRATPPSATPSTPPSSPSTGTTR